MDIVLTEGYHYYEILLYRVVYKHITELYLSVLCNKDLGQVVLNRAAFDLAAKESTSNEELLHSELRIIRPPPARKLGLLSVLGEFL